MEQVGFRIPSNWEDRPDGTGRLFLDDEKTVILRLNLLTMIKEDGSVSYRGMIRDLQESPLGRGRKVEILPNRNAFLEGTVSSGGRKIIYWQIAHYFPPNSFQIAAFTCEILEPMEDPEMTALLRREIRKTVFIRDHPSPPPP